MSIVMLIPKGYKIEETNERVPNVGLELTTRFKWRADRRCKRLNAMREVPFYRYEVHKRIDGRWDVAAMQNQLVPIGKDNGE